MSAADPAATRRGRPPKNPVVVPEKGVSGLSVSGGVIKEEREARFRGQQWRRSIGEMIHTDPVIGGIFLGIDLKIAKATRNLLPANDSAEALRIRDHIDSCFKDMNQSFTMTLFQINTMLPYGWSFFETIFKMRQGGSPKDQILADGSRRRPPPSKYDDGLIGWHKWGHRHPDTLDRWEFGPGGSLRGMRQRDPNTGKVVEIPITRALLFRPRYTKGNPEGISTLRNTYRAWYFKRNIEQLEAQGLERELTGMLILYLTQNLLGPEDEMEAEEIEARDNYIQMAEDLRVDPTTVGILPSVFDDKGNRLIEFKIVESAGQRQYDTDKIIARWDQRVAFATLAQFMLLGTEKVGSFALSSTQAALFTDALNTWAAAIADVVNDFGIRRLVEVNGWDPALAPVFSFSKITDASLRELSEYLETISKAGGTIFPNEPVMRELLDRAGLPSEELAPHVDQLTVIKAQAEAADEDEEPADDDEEAAD